MDIQPLSQKGLLSVSQADAVIDLLKRSAQSPLGSFHRVSGEENGY
jgi:hypothetical protein